MIVATSNEETEIIKINQRSKILVSGMSGREEFETKFDFLINAAGHGAYNLTKLYWKGAPAPPPNFAKGNYFTIAGKTPFQTLVYSMPGAVSLRIHFTINLDNRGQLGPNVQWVNQPNYEANESLKDEFRTAASKYWIGIESRELIPDYSGIRPKIEGNNFIIYQQSNIITLLGIDSPTLTTSLAIAEFVENFLDYINKNLK